MFGSFDNEIDEEVQLLILQERGNVPAITLDNGGSHYLRVQTLHIQMDCAVFGGHQVRLGHLDLLHGVLQRRLKWTTALPAEMP